MSPPRYQVLSPSLASGSLAPSGLVRYPLCGGMSLIQFSPRNAP
jgi:hypothetical protein